MKVSRLTIHGNTHPHDKDGKFLFPRNNFNKRLWAAQITGKNGSYIFDREFINKYEKS